MARQSGPSDILRYSHLGIQFAVVVLAGIWAGDRLDHRFGSQYFTLLGTFLGAAIGFYVLYREIDRAGSGSSGPSSPDPVDPDSGHGGNSGNGGDSGDAPRAP